MTLAEGKVNKQRQASNRKLAAAVFVGAMGKWSECPESPDMVGKIRKLLPTLNSRYASILA